MPRPSVTGPPSLSRTTLICMRLIPGVCPLVCQKYGKYSKSDSEATAVARRPIGQKIASRTAETRNKPTLSAPWMITSTT